MRSIPIIVILFITYAAGFAQIQPPALSCIEGSGTQIEIIWSPPGVQCGPLNGYEVFYSTLPEGPYTSFQINDPAILDTTFASSDPVIYCYMQSLMDCPGQIPVNSDTLVWDLNPPVMKTVSVNDNDQIEVTWYTSESPDIGAYLVYVDGDNIPDTVWGNGNNVYTDVVSDPGAMSHDYKIAWYRNCVDDGDRRGSIGLPYNTIYAQNLQQDRCGRTFNFSWNRYENYGDGVIGYEIEASSNTGPWTIIDTVPNNQQIYTFQSAQTNVYYCFRVNAILPNGCKAMSNQVCDTATVVQIPLGAQMRNATVLNDNNIQIEYYPDTIGDIQQENAERSSNGITFGGWPLSNEGTAGNPVYTIYKDNSSVNANANDYWYRYVRQDECNINHYTDTVKTVLLDAGIGAGLSGELEWTSYFNSNAVISGYTIIKIVNGVSQNLVTLGPTATTYIDLDALNATSLDTVCYQVFAEADLDILSIPGAVDDVVESYSNISCLNPMPRVIFPSAFRPEGFNNIFKPIISFGTSANYNFRIYDRYDRMLFETDDPNQGWDGTDNGQIAPMNNYVYYLVFTGQDGVLYEDAGNVILIR